MAAPIEQHYTVSQVGELVGGVSRATVWRWIAAGRASTGRRGLYPVRRISGGLTVVPASSLRRFLERSAA